ncbi:cyclic nucleotide-binding domain-containing protein [Desulfospira joergensenii]|uniref:cyclic nucleotide-binding domain-containing protein n=1 Tax=Desulfospira joergensenii TaxID=53329 RepID=UPI0003B37046|nr:cyclic nucleotide-binding domain-containing protein [Desulfospira joergensenii]
MTMEPDERVTQEKYAKYAQILEKTKWASEFSWDHICKLCQYIDPVMAKKGAVVFKEGNKDKSLGIIVKGSIDIIKQQDGKKSLITTLRSSQTFGEMALLDGEPRSATGVSTEDTIIFFISEKNLLALTDDDPTLGFKLVWKIARLVSQRLRKTTGMLVDYMG